MAYVDEADWRRCFGRHNPSFRAGALAAMIVCLMALAAWGNVDSGGPAAPIGPAAGCGATVAGDGTAVVQPAERTLLAQALAPERPRRPTRSRLPAPRPAPSWEKPPPSLPMPSPAPSPRATQPASAPGSQPGTGAAREEVAVTAVNKGKLALTLSLDEGGKKLEQTLKPGQSITLKVPRGRYGVVFGTYGPDGKLMPGTVPMIGAIVADKPQEWTFTLEPSPATEGAMEWRQTVEDLAPPGPEVAPPAVGGDVFQLRLAHRSPLAVSQRGQIRAFNRYTRVTVAAGSGDAGKYLYIVLRAKSPYAKSRLTQLAIADANGNKVGIRRAWADGANFTPLRITPGYQENPVVAHLKDQEAADQFRDFAFGRMFQSKDDAVLIFEGEWTSLRGLYVTAKGIRLPLERWAAPAEPPASDPAGQRQGPGVFRSLPEPRWRPGRE